MPAPRRLPLFAFGNVAHGVIAVGNIAHGVIAIGFTIAIGVVAIGMNAVGAVALGMNAVGPVTIAAVNGLGVWGAAGVNLIAGAGAAGINAGVSAGFGFGAAALIALVAEGLVRSSRAAAAYEGTGGIARAVDLATAAPGVHEVVATVARAGDRWTLAPTSGAAPIDVEVESALIRTLDRRAARGARCRCEVRVHAGFAADGDYRRSPSPQRRLRLVGVGAVDHRWLPDGEALLRLEARAFQLAAVVGAAAVALAQL